MALADFLPTEPAGIERCRFGQAIDLLPDEDLRNEVESWLEMRQDEPRWGMSCPQMAVAVSRASGTQVSDKTVGKHQQRLCCCYRA